MGFSTEISYYGNVHKETQCDKCEKPSRLCLCSEIRPVDNRHFVFLFQHPQEPDKLLGTARLTQLALRQSKLKVALSVPNLKKALQNESITLQKWGVLYLGSGIKLPPQSPRPQPGLYPVRKDGTPLPDPEAKALLAQLEGVILLDGTWSQAKTLWWRNSWLLKCPRLILVPRHRSLYGKLRKEPRAECLSTIETTAEVLDALGEAPEVGESLRLLFKQLLSRYSNPQA